MFLKMMEGDGFSVIEVTSVSFRRLEKPAAVFRQVGVEEERRVYLNGDAFLLNDNGDTIEKFVIAARPQLRKVGTT